MRLIDADALEDYIESDESGLCDAREFQRDYIECIDCMPTIDPVKHGHWILTEDKKGYFCSNCGVFIFKAGMWKHMASQDKMFNYCTHCGTKMDEVQHDQSKASD